MLTKDAFLIKMTVKNTEQRLIVKYYYEIKITVLYFILF